MIRRLLMGAAGLLAVCGILLANANPVTCVVYGQRMTQADCDALFGTYADCEEWGDCATYPRNPRATTTAKIVIKGATHGR